jgi:hypothetical protein
MSTQAPKGQGKSNDNPHAHVDGLLRKDLEGNRQLAEQVVSGTYIFY